MSAKYIKKGKLIYKIKQNEQKLTSNPIFSRDFSIEELEKAPNDMKSNRAAGFDGIYAEMLKNCGSLTKMWLCCFFQQYYGI